MLKLTLNPQRGASMWQAAARADPLGAGHLYDVDCAETAVRLQNAAFLEPD